jgi:hypothetical protein
MKSTGPILMKDIVKEVDGEEFYHLLHIIFVCM